MTARCRSSRTPRRRRGDTVPPSVRLSCCAAEADAEDRRTRGKQPPHPLALSGDPGLALVIGGLGRAEHRDDLTRQRLGQFGIDGGVGGTQVDPALERPGNQMSGLGARDVGRDVMRHDQHAQEVRGRSIHQFCLSARAPLTLAALCLSPSMPSRAPGAQRCCWTGSHSESTIAIVSVSSAETAQVRALWPGSSPARRHPTTGGWRRGPESASRCSRRTTVLPDVTVGELLLSGLAEHEWAGNAGGP